METHEVPGLFSGNVKVYHYPNTTSSKKVVLVLKGIYGEHVPNGDSWDNTLVKLLRDDYHLIFVRTSRLDGKEDRDAFVDKTFEQERTEIASAFEYCDKKIFSDDYLWGCVGVSLGGTILLSIPDVLSQMKLTMMVGSGCGKNPGTTKPLLSTLPETEQLLCSLDSYHETFIFLHGEDDTVVPIESQRMIYDRASKHPNKHEWINLPNLGHSLRDSVTQESHMAETISRYIQENF